MSKECCADYTRIVYNTFTKNTLRINVSTHHVTCDLLRKTTSRRSTTFGKHEWARPTIRPGHGSNLADSHA